ncbi:MULTISPECIES: glycosyltransferase family 2 protein [Paenibacillus]|uniref:Glycosyltransferase family 2 protein n=1 Tax=Paenibacillus baimaensis TaxID=2982185 RepID=A0ABT2UAM0_9BACL|nr:MULTISPECIES: glycosyltransferase family 2 protein [unclassified Paenibacillus]MCU6791617.1 glycosyltransferase family 2 protein [Paenibacillus sp. WQ 127069]OMF16308.1 glycosyl transferase family 2 [Paenibacillus sp. FSL H7-0331]
MEQAKILIVVPAYNEQNNILRVIWDIRKTLPSADILVVNDCSLDSTSINARKAEGVKVVDLPYNLGIGGAVQTGFKYALTHGYDYMVQIDGDGQHLPSEVVKLFDTMVSNSCDMVIGSRFLDIQSFRTTWLRRMGIKVFYLIFRMLINAKITDGTSGFRMYNRNGIALMAKYYPDDYPEPDAIILLKKHGLRIAEVGVEMKEREHGVSSISMIKSPYYMTKVIVSIFFSYIRTRW